MARIRKTYELPAAKALRWVFVSIPLLFVGIAVAIVMGEGWQEMAADPLRWLPVAAFLLLMPVIVFALLGRMAHTIEREGDRLTFKGAFRTVEMRFADVRTISTRIPLARRAHMGGMQGGNMLHFVSSDQKVQVMGFFTGLVDLINDIRAVNPDLELDGL